MPARIHAQVERDFRDARLALAGDRSAFARLIDHTLLRADATARDVERLCTEALAHGFGAVCVSGLHAARAARALVGSATRVCSVVDFPLGSQRADVALVECRAALDDGAREIDTPLPLGLFRAGDETACSAHLSALAEACRGADALFKVILECALLDDEEKARAARLARDAGADCVKTSSGFARSGASAADVALLARTVAASDVGPAQRLGVKAAGGIRERAFAMALLEAGATRLGASSSLELLA